MWRVVPSIGTNMCMYLEERLRWKFSGNSRSLSPMGGRNQEQVARSQV